MTLSKHELDRRLTALRREAQPPDRVWERLQSRLDRSRRLPVWLAAVASVAAISLVVIRLLDSPLPTVPSDPGGLRVSAELEVLSHDPFAQPWAQALERAPGFNDAWQENEAAISALKHALEADPNNLLLLEFLAEARFRQSELVQLAARVQYPSSLTE